MRCQNLKFAYYTENFQLRRELMLFVYMLDPKNRGNASSALRSLFELDQRI
jgi:hypothetical protein